MLNKKILNFLKKLKKNNNKLWFEEHKEEFKELHSAFSDFIHDVAEEVAGFDPRVQESLAKGNKKTVKIFRIYKDARFSKGKQSYKTNFGGVITPNGMESGASGYYLHLEPGSSFVGGGIYRPSADVLRNVREHIIEDEKGFRKILANKKFKETFSEIGTYDMLKTVPRGYDKEHPAGDLLRYKSFTAFKNFSDSDVTDQNFKKEVVKSFKTLLPLNTFLSK